MDHRVSVRYRRPYARFASTVRRAAQAALQHETDAPAEVVLVLMDVEGIRAANRRFRGVDQPTDVLAFPGGAPDPDTGVIYLGDVLIAVPIAERQAADAGHSPEDELSLLAIHGVLHLLGYDHGRPQERRQMWAVQATVLDSIGVGSGVVSKGDETDHDRVR